jgi:hypothetical protein
LVRLPGSQLAAWAMREDGIGKQWLERKLG